MSDDPAKFIPRETPAWMYWLTAPAVILMLAIWASGVWAIWQLVNGSVIVGALVLAVWLPVSLQVARVLHRQGRVRISVSLVGTIVVLLMAFVVAVIER
jgi:hypothetical protein